MWKCPKCKREFAKLNQMHSCATYSEDKHFENKKDSKKLYSELLKMIKKEIGGYRIESLPCCIHVVDPKNSCTYACVYALKDGIKMHIALEKPLKSSRIKKALQIGKNKYKYSIIIKDKQELDKELINWLKLANK